MTNCGVRGREQLCLLYHDIHCDV